MQRCQRTPCQPAWNPTIESALAARKAAVPAHRANDSSYRGIVGAENRGEPVSVPLAAAIWKRRAR